MFFFILVSYKKRSKIAGPFLFRERKCLGHCPTETTSLESASLEQSSPPVCVQEREGGHLKSSGRHDHNNAPLPPLLPRAWKQQKNYSSKTHPFASILQACSLSFLSSFIFSFTSPMSSRSSGTGKGGYSVHANTLGTKGMLCVGKLRVQALNAIAPHSVKGGHYLTVHTSEGLQRLSWVHQCKALTTQSSLDELSLLLFLLLFKRHSFAKIRI